MRSILPTYRRKSAVVDAFQITKENSKTTREWPEWLQEYLWLSNETGALSQSGFRDSQFILNRNSGRWFIPWGTFLVRDIHGNLDPCSPRNFHENYELLEPSEEEI